MLTECNITVVTKSLMVYEETYIYIIREAKFRESGRIFDVHWFMRKSSNTSCTSFSTLLYIVVNRFLTWMHRVHTSTKYTYNTQTHICVWSCTDECTGTSYTLYYQELRVNLRVSGRSSDPGRRTSATVHFNPKIPFSTDHAYRSKDVSVLS